MANTAHCRMTVGLGLGLLQYDTMLLLEPPSYIHQHQTTTWVLWQTAARCVCPTGPTDSRTRSSGDAAGIRNPET